MANSRCPADKRKFFNWLAGPLAKMAQDLNTTLEVLLTLAVKERAGTKRVSITICQSITLLALIEPDTDVRPGTFTMIRSTRQLNIGKADSVTVSVGLSQLMPLLRD